MRCRMDIAEETISPKEMLEKIAELDYNQSQLRDLNAEMRHWLDVADDKIAVLRSENANLRKQVKSMERIISEAQQVEAESCSSLLTDDLNVNKCSEKKIQDLEKKSAMMTEQNKTLIAKLKTLEKEREQDKMTSSQIKTRLQTFEFGMEEAALELQHRDEVIHQTNLQLMHLEETVEEYGNIIKDLRLAKQELRDQLEVKQDDVIILTELMKENEGLPSNQLSIAEEIQLLASSTEVNSSMTDFADLSSEAEDEEMLEPCCLTYNLKTQRMAGTLQTDARRAGLFVLCILSLSVLAFMALGGCIVNSYSFSINHVWSSAQLMLQPYFSVHYEALPPT